MWPTLPYCVLTSNCLICTRKCMHFQRTKLCAQQMCTLFGAKYEAISSPNAIHSDLQRNYLKLGQHPINSVTPLGSDTFAEPATDTNNI